MHQEIKNLVEDFCTYKGNLKRVKYPLNLWKKAVELCEHFSKKTVSDALKVNEGTLQRYISQYGSETKNPFIPIRIDPPEIPKNEQVITNSNSVVSIELKGTPSALAEFMSAFQGGGTNASNLS